MSAETPSLEELFEELKRAVRGPMFAQIPATVVSYDQAAQTIVARPAVQAYVANPETDVETPVVLPDVPNVPVRWDAVSGASLTFPLAQGDTVMLQCADRSLDEWKSTDTPLPYAAVDRRRFDLTDAVAVPISRVAIDGTGVASGAVVLRSSDIRLGSAQATIAPVLETALVSFLGTLKTWLDTHTHTSAAPGNPTTVPVVLSPAVPNDLGATKVVVE